MNTDAYAAYSEPGGMVQYDEPIMTFESYESSTTPIKPPSLTPVIDSSNILLSNLQHQRQQSAPNLAVSQYADTRPRSSGRGHTRHQSQGMPFTGDGRGGRRPENSPGRFGGWLSGTSASSVDESGSPNTTPKSKRSVAMDNTTPKSATPSRFGFLASSVSAFTTRLTNPQTPTTNAPSPRDLDDELCNLDIEAALYPSSSPSTPNLPNTPSDRDTFSPAAYKNLQLNAAGLLHKMQTAYRARTLALREIEAERAAQKEEAEETELRVRHFKNQLESMAAKAAEQESAMQRLVAELRAERRAREKMMLTAAATAGVGSEDGMEGPLITEDLCVDEEEASRKRWRKSNATVRSDLSLDTTTTDGDSAESESIFSRSRSPTALTSATESENVEFLTPATAVKTPPGGAGGNGSGGTPKLKPAPQLTAFQKLVKGISGVEGGVDGCRNCQGQDSSVAWDTVSLLRDENKSLKHRVAQLEVVVEGALDVVNGIGLP
ncbi:hypothetical protein F5Y04DRAFT_284491 [Hypomontagnella monticulosa]|nr:hypothetical protein F5Y04DRAFT_284491 [Hypomontagnella monticulosa]